MLDDLSAEIAQGLRRRGADGPTSRGRAELARPSRAGTADVEDADVADVWSTAHWCGASRRRCNWPPECVSNWAPTRSAWALRWPSCWNTSAVDELQPVLDALGLDPSPKPGPAGPSPASWLTRPAAHSSSEVGDEARDILERLSQGPPAGVLPATFTWPPPPGRRAVGTTAPTRVTELVRRGLLVLAGGHTAELPRELGLQLRGEQPLGWVPPHPPEALAGRREPRDIDATGSVAALELVRLVDALATSWSDDPPAQLRSGGLGVRDLRRTSKTLAVDEPMTALLVELAVAADLISAPMAREQPWRPTTDYDTWTERRPGQQWIRLAQAWRTMTRAPYLVGQRDERGKARSALSYEVERSTAPGVRGPRSCGSCWTHRPGPSAARARCWTAWPGCSPPGTAAARTRRRRAGRGRDPRHHRRRRVDVVRAGRAGRGPAQAERALSAVLPEPVDYFLLQPDLTLVVPGPPTPELSHEIALLADLESAGGASVFRLSEPSVRRAFDAGQSAAEIHAVLDARSRTPVPQALSYLVDDLARRHGVLRAGTAGCYLRCEDVSLLDRVVGDRTIVGLRWHRLAPTVAVTATEPARVLELLRTSGYAPAAEDLTGVSVTVGAAPARSRPRRPESNRTMLPPELPDSVLDDAARRMRRTDELARTAHRVSVGPNVPGVTSATTLNVLRQAIRSDGQVWVSVADGTGSTTSHILAPLSLAAGFLRGHDVGDGRLPHRAAAPDHVGQRPVLSRRQTNRVQGGRRRTCPHPIR